MTVEIILHFSRKASGEDWSWGCACNLVLRLIEELATPGRCSRCGEDRSWGSRCTRLRVRPSSCGWWAADARCLELAEEVGRQLQSDIFCLFDVQRGMAGGKMTNKSLFCICCFASVNLSGVVTAVWEGSRLASQMQQAEEFRRRCPRPHEMHLAGLAGSACNLLWLVGCQPLTVPRARLKRSVDNCKVIHSVYLMYKEVWLGKKMTIKITLLLLSFCFSQFVRRRESCLGRIEIGIPNAAAGGRGR